MNKSKAHQIMRKAYFSALKKAAIDCLCVFYNWSETEAESGFARYEALRTPPNIEWFRTGPLEVAGMIANRTPLSENSLNQLARETYHAILDMSAGAAASEVMTEIEVQDNNDLIETNTSKFTM